MRAQGRADGLETLRASLAQADAEAAKPFFGNYGGVVTQSPLRISTNLQPEFDPFGTIPPWPSNQPLPTRPSTTAGDVSESNALFAGASNIVNSG